MTLKFPYSHPQLLLSLLLYFGLIFVSPHRLIILGNGKLQRCTGLIGESTELYTVKTQDVRTFKLSTLVTS